MNNPVFHSRFLTITKHMFRNLIKFKTKTCPIKSFIRQILQRQDMFSDLG